MTLTGMENKIVDARKTGIAFYDMFEKEKIISATSVIFTIAVISGCQLPTNPAHVNALEQEFLKFINDYGYSSFTAEEILTAFRMNANLELEDKVETYGAVFNINYIGKVLNQYKYFRQVVDRKFADKFIHIQNEKYYAKKEMEGREKIKEQYQKYFADENAELDLSDFYNLLFKDGAFADYNYYEIFRAEAIQKVVQIDEDVHTSINRYERKMYIDLAAEKLAVKFLFAHMKLTGKRAIYDDKFNLLYQNFSVVPEEKELPF